jgi:hypothetical protein
MKWFAGWIYAIPSRCPALRLADEFYHAVRKNASYIPSDSLIGDFAHLECLPYVDLITLNSERRDPVRRVSDRIMAGCADRVSKNFQDEMMCELHLLRGCVAIKNGVVAIDQAPTPSQPDG